MRPSNKSRSRNKSGNSGNTQNQNRRSVGNIINRVFDSAGPDGKVRGTPQQIIEKYQALARDAQLANDRVAAESFQQHAEHYSRMLGEAQQQQIEQRGGQDRDDASRGSDRDDQPRGSDRDDPARGQMRDDPARGQMRDDQPRRDQGDPPRAAEGARGAEREDRPRGDERSRQDALVERSSYENRDADRLDARVGSERDDRPSGRFEAAEFDVARERRPALPDSSDSSGLTTIDIDAEDASSGMVETPEGAGASSGHRPRSEDMPRARRNPTRQRAETSTPVHDGVEDAGRAGGDRMHSAGQVHVNGGALPEAEAAAAPVKRPRIRRKAKGEPDMADPFEARSGD